MDFYLQKIQTITSWISKGKFFFPQTSSNEVNASEIISELRIYFPSMRKYCALLKENMDYFSLLIGKIVSVFKRRQVTHCAVEPKEVCLEEKQDTPCDVGARE